MSNTPPDSLKVCACVGPLTSQKTGKQFFLVQAETPNIYGGGWSTIRWTAITEKPCAIGAALPLLIRKLDTEKGEGQFDVR